MSGLECSEVSYSEVVNRNRSDSEYYKKVFINNEKKLQSLMHFYIKDSFKVTDGEHGSVEYLDSGVKYLTAENIKNGYVDISSVKYVSEEVDRRNARARVCENDILISIKGTLGAVALADKTLLPCNMNRDVSILKAVKNDGKINSFVAFFLMSKCGLLQSMREGSGGVQQMITLERLREAIVPLFNDVFYNELNAYYRYFLDLRESANIKYHEAEKLLLSTLALDDFTPTKENTSIKTFSQVTKSERLDAEYYQPKFDELMKRIYAHAEKIISVKEIRTENHRGVQPDYIEEGEVAVVNSKNILEKGLDYDGFSATSRALWELIPKAHIEKGDILIYTTGANVGRTALYRSDKPALASNHVNILRVTHKHPKYIAFVINSMIGRLQTERLSTGSAQQELYPSDIDSFLIPIISETKQAKIEALLDKSYALREQSKALLKAATRAVEIAIEQDEAAGMKYLQDAQQVNGNK